LATRGWRGLSTPRNSTLLGGSFHFFPHQREREREREREDLGFLGFRVNEGN